MKFYDYTAIILVSKIETAIIFVFDYDNIIFTYSTLVNSSNICITKKFIKKTHILYLLQSFNIIWLCSCKQFSLNILLNSFYLF